MFRRKKSVNKKVLQHKLYLARETPEPVFDLSECDLNEVPTGIYSLCKVFLKESLILFNNQLCSLAGGGDLGDLCFLRVLDIHNNTFDTLPEEICLLKNLQELYLHKNKLKKLPLGLYKLVNLKILNVSDNYLKNIQDNIGELINLRKLDVSSNKHLNVLPKKICKAQRIVLIELDADNFVYPPSEVACNGTKAIMKYISNDENFPYVPPEDLFDIVCVNEKQINDETDNLQAQIRKLESIKLQKLQEFLEIEKTNELLHQKELEMAETQRNDKQKLLKSIAETQKKYDMQLNKIQQEREIERFHLIEQLQEAENNADISIQKLLTLNKEPLEQLIVNEKLEEEKLLAVVKKYSETLRKHDILTAMQNILKQEAEKFVKFDQGRVETSRSILEQEMAADSRLSQVLHDKDLYHAELVSELLVDDHLQKAAVATLLERGDARSWALVQQVRLVEAQLASLTMFELNRRKYRMDEHLNDLSEKRLSLSILLSELMEQQRERRARLLSTLESITESYDKNEEDFWLRQYQILLEKLPEGLSEAQRNIDPRLAQALLLNGVIHCLPFLANLTQTQQNASNVTENELIAAGISNSGDRLRILDALHMFGKEKVLCEDFRPSAPDLEFEEASAPPDEIQTINSIECVVCLDLECQIIFVPCGHLCCCSKCSISVTECPLCRSSIERKISIIL